jgi:CRISPR-associated protein Csh2
MKRSELIFLYDIKDNNPNGDPNDDNKPRIDEETGINYVTDVRLKRTCRDYLFEYKQKEIFVREIETKEGNIQDGKARAKDFGSDKKDIYSNVLDKCIDVRLFGATIPLDKDSITFTGPVQFNIGRSLHRVALKRIKGTGAFASAEDKQKKTFREEHILPYSLIGFYGIINEHAAEITLLKQEDIDLLIESMWNGTKNLISRSKIGQMPRMLLKINYKNSNFHIGDLIKKIKLQTDLNEEEEIRGPEDYILKIDDLIDTFAKKSEKIDSIEFSVDDSINFSYKGKAVKLSEALADYNAKKINIEG